MNRATFTPLALVACVWLAATSAFGQSSQPDQPAPVQTGEVAVLGERIETVRAVADARISATEVDYNAKFDVMRADISANQAENNANFERLRVEIANLGLLIIMWMIGVGATLLGVPWLRERRERKSEGS